MSDVWTPMIQHREPLPMCNILELLDGTRLESGTVREVRAFARGAGSCWVARFDGLDAALMPQRTFMKERGTSHREVDGIWLREDLFSCEEDGFYEARSWMPNEGFERGRTPWTGAMLWPADPSLAMSCHEIRFCGSESEWRPGSG